MLLQRQWLFEECFHKWSAYIHARGWRLTQGEGYVGDTDARDGDHDGPHMAGGGHYSKTSGDRNLWVPDPKNNHPDRQPTDPDGWRLIRKGGTPEWREAGAVWKQLHPLCRWGGDFAIRDDNHISVLSPTGKA